MTTESRLSPDDEDDARLMRAYAAGDHSAFDEIFHRYGGRILGRMQRTVGAGAAPDLTQQTFLQLHRARREFRTGDPFAPWLMTIARNVLRDHLRRRGRAPASMPILEEPVGQSSAAIPSEAREALHAAIVRLPPSQSAVVRRRWFEHQTYAQIASELGISQVAAKVRAHRACGALRRILAAQGFGDR